MAAVNQDLICKMWEACETEDIPTIHALLESHPGSQNWTDWCGDTPLHRAAVKGKLEVVVLLLSARANLNRRNNEGCTPLHEACLKGRTLVVDWLLGAHANPNVTNDNGHTPLDIAKQRNWREIIILFEEYLFEETFSEISEMESGSEESEDESDSD
eukprot:CAMPEP_0201536106 /NCGR_PEP_ID=MMETSP0161_2-20130828/60968_1 /ASSEMBLY_ACC=CAM_ASM_000251 /TAXON_ID=180227 /ORGANISM="Neoparamoeba aestuarina, Strain SoJaBio B1-5/56/2" /LENGTH=156 /DNA_ID=CAMNT_0047941617 /DNA_START=80 /DNA_END=547 /DNA_ORIENTATION=-